MRSILEKIHYSMDSDYVAGSRLRTSDPCFGSWPQTWWSRCWCPKVEWTDCQTCAPCRSPKSRNWIAAHCWRLLGFRLILWVVWCGKDLKIGYAAQFQWFFSHIFAHGKMTSDKPMLLVDCSTPWWYTYFECQKTMDPKMVSLKSGQNLNMFFLAQELLSSNWAASQSIKEHFHGNNQLNGGFSSHGADSADSSHVFPSLIWHNLTMTCIFFGSRSIRLGVVVVYLRWTASDSYQNMRRRVREMVEIPGNEGKQQEIPWGSLGIIRI